MNRTDLFIAQKMTHYFFEVQLFLIQVNTLIEQIYKILSEYFH